VIDPLLPSATEFAARYTMRFHSTTSPFDSSVQGDRATIVAKLSTNSCLVRIVARLRQALRHVGSLKQDREPGVRGLTVI
jgi:hypothetical protein